MSEGQSLQFPHCFIGIGFASDGCNQFRFNMILDCVKMTFFIISSSSREFEYDSRGFNLYIYVSPVSIVKCFPIVTIVTSANYTPRAFGC